MTESKFDMSSIKYPDLPFFSDRPKLPKVKYSTMTEGERLWLARDTGYILVEEIYSGIYKFYKTNVWYDPLLKVVKDLGYDTSALQITDWNDIEDVVLKFDEIICDIESKPEFRNGKRRVSFIEQVIFDC